MIGREKRLLLALPAMLLLAAGWQAYGWLQSPATVSNDQQTGRNVSDVLGSQITLTNWQTGLFSTRLPTYLYAMSSTEQPSKPILASYVLTSRESDQNDQVAITIGKLGNGTLQEVSAVKLRVNQPQTYTPTVLENAPTGTLAFKSNGNYEESVFWQHDSRYVAVVVSGTSDRQPELHQALSSIVSNWQWR